jgi:hypothetical protein
MAVAVAVLMVVLAVLVYSVATAVQEVLHHQALLVQHPLVAVAQQSQELLAVLVLVANLEFGG